MVGGIVFLRECYGAWRDHFPFGKVKPLLFASFTIAVPFVIEALWTAYSDSVRAHNQIGMLLTSRALMQWNFGTWDQRISSQLWQSTILDRTLSNTFGYAAIPAIVLIGTTLRDRDYMYPALAAVLAFFVPFFVFTNLHIVHTYYQASNAIFIIAAVGLGLAAVFRAHVGIAFTFLALILVGQLIYFRSNYNSYLTRDFSNEREIQILTIAKSMTGPTQSLIVIGDDWSSAIPTTPSASPLRFPHGSRSRYCDDSSRRRNNFSVMHPWAASYIALIQSRITLKGRR